MPARAPRPQFDIVAVDAAGKQVARPGIEYKIERTDWIYQWYQVDGRWRWQSIANDAAGRRPTPCRCQADQPARLSFNAELGRRIASRSSTARTTPPARRSSMSAGTAARTAARRRPTRCAWPATRKTTRRARPRACASRRRSPARRCWPSPPTASSARATSQVPAGGTTIEVPVSADWGPGAYALVTAWRPLDKPADRTPTRAIGAAWLGLDPKLRTLAVADRHAREGHAAPAHRGADQGRQSRRARKPSSPWPRSMRASCSSRASRRPIPPTTTSASAGSASPCATTTAACSKPAPTISAASASAATPATSAASTSCRRAPSRCSAGR